MNSKELKEQHEIAIGDQFLNALQCDRKFIRHGKDDREPDLIYSLADKTVGLEIATVYCDDDQAKVEWQLARDVIKWDPPRWVKIGSWTEPDKLIIARMQQEVDDKCAKTYSGVDTVWLCIELHYPLATVSNTEKLVAAITVPVHRFQRIYLGFHASVSDGGGFRVSALFGGPTTS